MTNAEAIETLRANYPDACYEQLREAVDVAIEALKAQDAARDTISRQAAIEDVKSWGVMNRYEEQVRRSIIEWLEDFPSAQPKPKEGHWIDKGWSGDWAWQIDGRGNCWRVIECSECGKSVSVESNFCPHCGAYMKGGTT